MEIPSSSTTSSSPPTTTMSKLFQFIRWQEVLVSNEKGRREVHYYLIKKDGTKDFAVLGKERTIRHMSYSYVLPTLSSSSYPLLPHKLKSRREVIDWLSSLVSDSSSGGLSQPIGGFVGNNDASDIPAFKDLHMRKLGNHSKEFLWLGSAWTCRKRRRHYQSFCRNGITVSVHDFIYVLAEENKRLVAYLEDLYEDSRGNKMVGVRWFHKIDEVGIVLPPNFNDREIFFSLCLQDLSVECIDGLATVLSPQHFEKFRKEVSNTQWKPFMCHRQFDNDDIEAFDITQVQGYWKQEILRQMYSSCPSKNLIPDVTADGLELGADDDDDDDDDALRTRPKKKHRSSKSRDLDQQVIDKRDIKEPFNVDIQKASNTLVVGSSGAEISCLKEGSPAACFSMKNIDNQIPIPNLAVGCHVEVLSQDSGIKGCWFRAVVVKRHKNKVKVQYQDIKDAVDEANNLEEWVLSSRIATPDKLGLRLRGRTTVRPYPSSNRGKASLGLLDVGTSVDAWWHDGWWEGIVVRKESNVRVQVYFPGEGRMSNFGCNDLRRSQDWVCNKWNHIRKKPDLVISILSGLETRTDDIKSTEAASKLVQLMNESGKQIKTNSNGDHLPPKDEKASCTKTIPCLEPRQDERGKVEDVVPNLAKDNLLTMLKWNSSRKRRRSREGLPRRGSSGDGSSSSGRDDLMSPHASESFVIPNSLKLDTEICKYRGDSVLNATISTLTSLVMSR